MYYILIKLLGEKNVPQFSYSTPKYYPRELKGYICYPDPHTNVQSKFICNNQNLETNQQVNGKQIVAHPYNETQLNNKNEWNIYTHHNMDESQNNYAKQKQPGSHLRKKYILCDSIHIEL